ncbi:hypothetical protein P152DRAFT_469521 [Eremomyces bilateralis CBS 781.70]|uniref:Inner kinetochore subunit AME1 domain-containing protein n=1 Tax=Eremomyces bilateralis CBS 781.70 TaxID=1392243 RepID=A0A6G1GG07_9PEZI|nr:uncharacterized protein P152DRAFT_469521 [Eremomyces bilateralis CBS 781.70]KAF1817027.1 hypothetical protein P152DRAFT_469521 [Eremomyces bilateralis CBS 781.70]
MAPNDRQERRLLRQRGAGTREIKNADFGFSFGPSIPPREAPTPAPLNPKPSSRKTPRNRGSGVSKKTPASTKTRSARKTPATSTKSTSTKNAGWSAQAEGDSEVSGGFAPVQEEPEVVVSASEGNRALSDHNDTDPLVAEEREQRTPNVRTQQKIPVQHTPEQTLGQNGQVQQEDEGPKTLGNKRTLRSAKAKSTGKKYHVVPSKPLPAASNGRLSMSSLNLGKTRASMGGSIVPSANIGTPLKTKSFLKGKENVTESEHAPPSVERGRRRTRLPLEDLEEAILNSPKSTEPIAALGSASPHRQPDKHHESTVDDASIERHIDKMLGTPVHNQRMEREGLAAEITRNPITTSPLFVTPKPRTPSLHPSSRITAEMEPDRPEATIIDDASTGDELDEDVLTRRRNPPQRQLLHAALEDSIAPSPAMSAMTTFTDPSYEPETHYIPRKRRSDELPAELALTKRQRITIQVELQPPSREPSPDPVAIPSGTSIPITTHRLANPPPSHPTSTAVTAPEVLAQVTSELTHRLLATHLAIQQPPTGPAAHARKSNILRAFDSTLQTTLFELAETAYASDVLESRLRRARADLALRREELMTVRRERDNAALRMDEVRARFSRAEKETVRRRDLVRRWERVGFALDQVQDGVKETGQDESHMNERLSLQLQDVAMRVCGKEDDGLLGKLKEFNGLLERAAEVIEGTAVT